MGRKATWIVAILLLLNTGALGLYNGVSELSDALTPLQKSVTVGVLIYGLLGLAGTATLIVKHRYAVPISAAWAIVVTYVAFAAPLAYGGEDATLAGAIAGAIGAGIIGLLVVWCARAVTRPATLHERLHGPPSEVG